MAVGFLLGFLLGLLALAVAQGAALLWAIRSLRRRGAPPAAAAELAGDRPFPCEKQGFLSLGKLPPYWNITRKVAPFIWLNREPSETASHSAGTATFQPEDVAALKVSANNKANKSSPPASSTRSDGSLKNTISTHGPKQEPAAQAWVCHTSLASESEPSLCDVTDQLRTPLLSTRQSEEDASENGVGSPPRLQVAGGEQPSSTSSPGEDAKRKGGRRARVMDLGRKMGDKLEAKGKHIVEKMKENAAARTNNSLERSV